MNKTILFFSGDITRSGGTERVCSQVTNSFVETGYAVHIVSLIEAAETPFYEFNDAIKRHVLLQKPVSPISRAIFKFFPIFPRLLRLIRREGIDIIIDVDGILDIFSLPAKLFTKVKVITWEHFNFYTDLGNRLRSLLKKASARWSDYIITLTAEDKSYYQQNLRLKCPIENIYNPVDMHDDEGTACQENRSADTFTTYDKPKNIISAGRLTAQKGFDMLIDVAKIVFAKHPDWTWTIAGEGEDRAMLTAKIAALGLEKHIILAGNVKNIGDYYENAAMFVLTSRFEGFGLVITEAKKYRLPVVAFACMAGPRELILDGQNGFLIDCENDNFDIAGMAEKICLLISDEALRRKFAEHSFDDTEKLSYQAVMKKWTAVINELSYPK